MILRPLCDSQQTNNPPPAPGHRPAHRGCWVDVLLASVSVVIAEGKRPVSFRTRKLSPPAPMVLHPGGCGRVGRRRTQPCRNGPPGTGVGHFSCPEAVDDYRRVCAAGADLAAAASPIRPRPSVREHRERQAAVVGPAADRDVAVVRCRRAAFHRAAERAGVHVVQAGDRALVVRDQVEGGVRGRSPASRSASYRRRRARCGRGRRRRCRPRPPSCPGRPRRTGPWSGSRPCCSAVLAVVHASARPPAGGAVSVASFCDGDAPAVVADDGRAGQADGEQRAQHDDPGPRRRPDRARTRSVSSGPVSPNGPSPTSIGSDARVTPTARDSGRECRPVLRSDIGRA